MTNEAGDPIHVAERANLCLEARASAARQAEYEAFVASRVDATSAYWHDLREAHDAYVQQFVRGGNGKDSAAFRPGETTLCQPGEDNQYVLRLENLNSLLAEEGFLDDRQPDLIQAQAEAERINSLIAARKQQTPQPRPQSVQGFANLGQLIARRSAGTPQDAALESLTDALNVHRRDRRPSFISFDAEFLGLDQDSDWLNYLCQRCGLAHGYTGHPVVLALFRYRVEDVYNALPGKPVFAVPTTLEQPFYSVFFPAPAGVVFGHAVALEPQDDCGHLAAELVHARIDYAPEHWVRVGVLHHQPLDASHVTGLRAAHLRCLRLRTGLSDYGSECI